MSSGWPKSSQPLGVAATEAIQRVTETCPCCNGMGAPFLLTVFSAQRKPAPMLAVGGVSLGSVQAHRRLCHCAVRFSVFVSLR